MIKYKVMPDKDKKGDILKHSILVLTILFPISGYFLINESISIRGFTVPFTDFIVPVTLQLFFIVIYIGLKHLRFKGSYIPFVCFALLMGIGMLFQVRQYIGIEHTTATGIGIKSSGEIARDAMVYRIKGLNTHYLAFFLAQLSLFGSIVLFSKRKFSDFGKKYMLIFSVTVVSIALLVLLSHVLGKGKFLYSRTPWELAKITLPLAFAGFFAQNSRFFRIFSEGKGYFSRLGWIPLLFIIGLPFFLFLLLGDLGQVFLYSMLILFLLYISTESLFYPLIGLAAFVLLPFAVDLFSFMLPDYVLGRLVIWQDFWQGFPSSVWWDKTYQTANSLFALQSGGFVGRGIGNGFPDLIPLSVSDFAYSGLIEEIGFVGGLGIFLLYLSIILKGIQAAFHSANRFDFIAISGLSMVLFCQVFINVGGVTNFIPLTGIVLPFISKGGFSLITFSIIVGLVMSASHKNVLQYVRKEHSGYELGINT